MKIAVVGTGYVGLVTGSCFAETGNQVTCVDIDERKVQKLINGAEVIFLALPTPPGEDGSADLKYILKVAGDLGQLLKDYAVIVDKSTVPVGTAEKVHDYISLGAQVAFDVVSNPEFLREGVAIKDFMKPDRVGPGSLATNQRLPADYQPN